MPHSHGGQIHQADGLCLAAQGVAGFQVGFVGLLQQGVFKMDAVNDGAEGGVTAVVRPVGVDHPDFRDGGVPVLADKVGLAEGNVIQIHGQAILTDESIQTFPVQLGKAVQGGNLGGDFILDGQCFGNFQGCFPALHRVDDILLKLRNFRLREVAVQGVDLGGADQGTLALGDNLDTLGGGVGPLVELTGQGFHGKNICAGQGYAFAGGIQLGLREHGFHGVVKQLPGDVFCVVAVEQPHMLQILHAQKILGFAQQAPGFVVQAFLLFYKYTINHGVILLVSLLFPYFRACNARWPMSLLR